MTRTEKAAVASALRAEGLKLREVAEQMGLSVSYVHSLLTDPDGSKDRARKDSYAGPCVVCGGKTNGSDGRRDRPLCICCSNRENGAKRAVWTRETICEAMVAWADEFGEPPSMNCWGMAIHTVNDPERQALYVERNAAGLIPHAQRVVHVFGSWNAAVEAAGLTPHAPHGGGGNVLRRRSVRGRAAA